MTEPKKQVLSHRVRRGENDLATLFPSLLEEWDYELNELNPSDFTAFSNQHAYWVCSRGHRWTAIIESRTRIGSGCPFCSNRVVTPNENDLATLFPEIAKEWDFDQNTKGPEQYLAKSDEKVGWICQKCGHRWQAYIKHRTNGSGCPRCKRHISNNKQAACIKRPSVRLGENDLASQRPNLLKEWDYEKNTLLPEQHAVFSHTKAWWICPCCGYNWQADISSRSNGSKCPCCANRVAVPGKNDLKTLHPEIAAEWCYGKNENGPSSYTPKSGFRAWWKCKQCGHEWQASIKNRTNGTKCPCCSGQVVVIGKNDLASQRPNLLDEWDYEQNKLPPERFSVFSHMKVWWVCKMCKTPYQARIEDRAKGSGCMHCLKRNAHQRKVL